MPAFVPPFHSAGAIRFVEAARIDSNCGLNPLMEEKFGNGQKITWVFGEPPVRDDVTEGMRANPFI